MLEINWADSVARPAEGLQAEEKRVAQDGMSTLNPGENSQAMVLSWELTEPESCSSHSSKQTTFKSSTNVKRKND